MGAEKKEQILAALKKLGPSSPGVIANSTGIEPSLCGYHLKTLRAAGAITATGRTSGRVYALAGGEGGGKTASPPLRRKKKRKYRKAKRPRAAMAQMFIPALDGETRLVIVRGAAPQIFSPEETKAIATLLLQHFE